MAKVLIATLWNPDAVLLASHRLGPDRLFLLTDKTPEKKQQESFKLIKDSLGRVIDIKEVKTEVYDVVSVAEKCVELIDSQPKEDIIYVNITSGRKTKALGLLYAAYCRLNKVKKIAYNPEEDPKQVVYLPKLGFHLSESQKNILQAVDTVKYTSATELAEKLDMSRAMFYRAIEELRQLGYLETEEGYKLTDAGRIARL